MFKFTIVILYLSFLIYTSVGNTGPCKIKKSIYDGDTTLEKIPEEAEDFIEGDIIPNENRVRKTRLKNQNNFKIDDDQLIVDNDTEQTSNIFPQEYLGERWPNATVPFVFHNLVGDKGRKQVIRAMNEYHRRTCIQFKKHTDEVDFLVIGSTMTLVCASSVGKQGGPQVLHLGKTCYSSIGTPMHELMHALGFIHEHMRPDRNKYVYINYSNIKPEFRNNFREVNPGIVPTALQVGYDFGSLMHYRLCAMTNNSWPTIVPKVKPKVKAIGQRRGFSKKDIQKLNIYYNCSKGRHAEILYHQDFTIQAGSHVLSTRLHLISTLCILINTFQVVSLY